MARHLAHERAAHRPARAAAGRSALVAAAGNAHLVQMRQRVVDGLEVPAHHVAALAAVALLDRVLDARDRLLARQHAGDGEEAGLQDGVDRARRGPLRGRPWRRRSRRSAASCR